MGSIIHYSDVIMSAMASQITFVSIVYSAVSSGADQRKHQSSASLAFVREIHRSPVNSPNKGPVIREMFPFDDGIMVVVIDDNKTIGWFNKVCRPSSRSWYQPERWYYLLARMFLAQQTTRFCSFNRVHKTNTLEQRYILHLLVKILHIFNFGKISYMCPDFPHCTLGLTCIDTHRYFPNSTTNSIYLK